jgi:hypothetical protein
MMIQTATIQFTLEVLGVVAGIDESKGAWHALGTLAPDRPGHCPIRTPEAFVSGVLPAVSPHP